MGTEDHKQALPPSFRLGAYRVVRVLGVGGFGVTYLCEHSGLGVQVAVKEYLPNEIAVRDGTEVHPKSAGDREGFEWGLSRFLDEARTLARFEHPNVVRVRDCFEANNTAYIVMDYEDGEPLDAVLRRHGTLTEAQLKRVLLPVVDGLRQVHAAGFLHRDIKPSNIFVRRLDESPVLLDFGSARQALGRRSRSVTAIASAGYSPPEQYERDGAQGAWTDIYALSALCYRAITGEAPMEATGRQSQLLRTQTDPLPKLAETPAAGFSPAFLEAVDWGLRVIETERPRSLDGWLARLGGATTPRQATSPPTALRTSERGATKVGAGAVSLMAALGSLLVIGLVWFVKQQDAGRPSVEQPEQPATFTVLPQPVTARVRILNIGSPYRAGMKLAAGPYQVEASAPGYATKTDTVAHGTSPTLHRMALLQSRQPFTVLVAPADARVRILGFGRPYSAGMELLAGSYQVEASAPGYVTKTETVAHRAVPTLHRMALSLREQPFTVEVKPTGAQVRILNIAPPYRAGMTLAAGTYEVEASAPGYETKTETVAHGTVPTLHPMTLSPLAQPFTVQAEPTDARVRILNIGLPYQPGVELATGSYEVEASAQGYETKTETVAHGTVPTVHRMVLSRLEAAVTVRVEPPERLRDCAECPEMVVLPPGTFRMGSPLYEQGRSEHEGPVREVTIAAPFAISRHEVTVSEFGRFVDETGYSAGSSCWTHRGSKAKDRKRRGWRSPGFDQSSRHPVACVSWDDAQAYTAWLSRETGEDYRLPSESEWEYAARAGTVTARHWGEGQSGQCSHANGADASADSFWTQYPLKVGCNDGHGRTSPVGSYASNDWGLHDMLGNVWEWTGDCWNDSYAGAPADGSAWEHGDCSMRVIRGGSWGHSPAYIRVATRLGSIAGVRDNYSGFRVARTLAP